MAGKSGTAQVVGMPENFDNDAEVPEQYRDHALFISFAPVDAPKIAVAVFIEHGEGGSSVAGPIARKVLDAYLLEEGELKAEFIYPQIANQTPEQPEQPEQKDEPVIQPSSSIQPGDNPVKASANLALQTRQEQDLARISN